MTFDEFDQQLKIIQGEFDGLNFTPVKTEMLWNSAQHLPRESFEKIVLHMVRTFRKPPLVQDFLDAVSSEKRSLDIQPFQPTAPVYECKKCNDLGVVQAWASDFEVLAKCDCDAGEKNLSSLPKVAKLGPRFRAEPVPPKLFRPENEGDAFGNAMKIAAWWKDQIKLNEKKWSEYETTND